jgi:hypothetical protein
MIISLCEAKPCGPSSASGGATGRKKYQPRPRQTQEPAHTNLRHYRRPCRPVRIADLSLASGLRVDNQIHRLRTPSASPIIRTGPARRQSQSGRISITSSWFVRGSTTTEVGGEIPFKVSFNHSVKSTNHVVRSTPLSVVKST